MKKLSVEDIISKITDEISFHAEVEDGSFEIKIEEYTPYICTAIHDGHRLRDELKKIAALNDYERWYEEDPHTGNFIKSLPITLIGKDSRYEYDLNRGPENAVYDEAWGKRVWKRNLTDEERARSMQKHTNYYRVIDALVSKLENKFGACVLYDIHSYNYKRHPRLVPVFNIGSEKIAEKFGPFVMRWKNELKKIEVPNLENTTEINDIFYGRGYQLEYVTKKFSNTLVLATEVKKIYTDEETEEDFPVVIDALRHGFRKAIISHAAFFAKKLTSLKVVKKDKLLSSALNKETFKIDQQLYRLLRNFELLNFVNPTNIEQERKRFFSSKYQREPEFRYPQLIIDPYSLKQQLFAIRVQDIEDVSLQNLYKDVIRSYVDKIDMLATLGTDTFRFNSLRYFGEPDERDIANARFLLHYPLEDPPYEKNITDVMAQERFQTVINQYGFNSNIRISTNTVSDAMVLNSKRLLLIKKGVKFSEKDIGLLANHEVGVHLVTTENSNLQPLNVFNLGLPLNTLTQEGMAVLSEYLSGNLKVSRLKELGLRVMAAHHMARGESFSYTFASLVEEHKTSPQKAFSVTTRIYRGGGFTKDYVYLKGFRDIYKYWKSGKSLQNLLIGKTSLPYINTINELVERKILVPPKYKTMAFENPTPENNPAIDFLVEGIK